MTYYERAVRNSPVTSPLRYELAQLYMKLKRYTDAEVLIKEVAENKGIRGNMVALNALWSTNSLFACRL